MDRIRALIARPWSRPPLRRTSVASLAVALYRAERKELGAAAELSRCMRAAAAMVPRQSR
ncbi:hypothetical protein E0493_12495 [Roseomonas sp. M0104]|uniref:Uncharacterized protein n=1 Tax=Teichococcus coralli TaxID=2545983 RepID=A0A845BDP0_9PROT|nr:hypothetical protein [Pseudoroseomonas coralli]MXP64164.1 hypothetical protein [Pseudoroseomonas coralli]